MDRKILSRVFDGSSSVDQPAAAGRVKSLIKVIQQFENIDEDFNREATEGPAASSVGYKRIGT
jgi:hypothetical protein